MIQPQLVLETLRGSGRARLKLRRPHVAPVVRRLAEHVWRVRGYQPFPDLLAVAAEALLAWLGAKTEEEREAVRAKAVRLPRYVTFGCRTETTVGEVVEHLELAGFAAGGELDQVALLVAAHAGRA